MVRTIPPKPQIGNNTARHTETVKKLRVAAYVRVSTENEEQQTSFEAQYEHYYDYITNHPAWEFAGIYADDGISAVSTKYREQFNKMIQDCMDGKIDYVVTKSISRFARNTVDCLNFVRKLKDKNIGILITDHNVQETLSITDRAYLLFEGKILFQGTPEELAENKIVREKYLSNSFVLRRKDFQLKEIKE